MTRKLIAEHGPELGQKYAKELEKQIIGSINKGGSESDLSLYHG